MPSLFVSDTAFCTGTASTKKLKRNDAMQMSAENLASWSEFDQLADPMENLEIA